ncbi:hypothetical protein [Streptomyces sp. MCL20-2]|uniref:hypothetical protein n=1 Tax=Streptomyces sp. MCL20-2 TaxID=2967219 RepID=UPI0029661E12|nr:hypothetical protein [Streptomyces sp. MCL20-2]
MRPTASPAAGPARPAEAAGLTARQPPHGPIASSSGVGVRPLGGGSGFFGGPGLHVVQPVVLLLDDPGDVFAPGELLDEVLVAGHLHGVGDPEVLMAHLRPVEEGVQGALAAVRLGPQLRERRRRPGRVCALAPGGGQTGPVLEDDEEEGDLAAPVHGVQQSGVDADRGSRAGGGGHYTPRRGG